MRVEMVYGAMAVDGLDATLMHEYVFVHSGCDASSSVVARMLPASRSDRHCLPHPASRKRR